ncbi:MAG: DNA recombination protein RmuC [Hyphomicrobiales bacterium]|nr:DNA recombination protein RmuC [Hyphomicrobiales bacterium]
MFEPVTTLFGQELPLAALVLAGGALALVLLLVVIVVLWRNARAGAAAEAAARELETRLAELARTQGEMTGRVQAMAEVFGARQAELVKALTDRLDNVSHRLGQSMSETQKNTHENLQQLHARLAVIDSAQANITALAGQVVELQAILSNKQTRGAFGQGRMEAIVADGLPKGAYTFQAKLSNERRPDCLIHMPNDAPDLVIDAKFPLEAYNALRAAETAEAEKAAMARFRQDVFKHIADIAERYFLPGETQDTAFMFVPSESLFAELNERFADIVQRAYRARIVIVSPSLLLLSIQVIQAVLRDQRMREQAHVIQFEVAHLMEDVARLNDRVLKLQTHFAQANGDVENILISTRKLTRRGGRIESLEFASSIVKADGEDETQGEAALPAPRAEAGE